MLDNVCMTTLHQHFSVEHITGHLDDAAFRFDEVLTANFRVLWSGELRGSIPEPARCSHHLVFAVNVDVVVADYLVNVFVVFVAVIIFLTFNGPCLLPKRRCTSFAACAHLRIRISHVASALIRDSMRVDKRN